jgi:hypothetical protein
MNISPDARGQCPRCQLKIVGCLQIKPELGSTPEITRQAQSCVRGYASPAIHDLTDSGHWNSQITRQPVDADV